MKEPCWKRGPPKIWKAREGPTKYIMISTNSSGPKRKRSISATLSLCIVPRTHTHDHVLGSLTTGGLDRIVSVRSPRILRSITWKSSKVPLWRPPLPETASSDSLLGMSLTVTDRKLAALSESEKAWKGSQKQQGMSLRRVGIEIEYCRSSKVVWS